MIFSMNDVSLIAEIARLKTQLAIAEGMLAAAREKAESTLKGKTPGTEKPPQKRNRGHLPPHLPRIERVIEPKSTLCPCGCGEMTKIGEDVSERLDVVPAQLRVLVTRRPRYACRHCSGAVAQAHAPEQVVPAGLPTGGSDRPGDRQQVW